MICNIYNLIDENVQIKTIYLLKLLLNFFSS